MKKLDKKSFFLVLICFFNINVVLGEAKLFLQYNGSSLHSINENIIIKYNFQNSSGTLYKGLLSDISNAHLFEISYTPLNLFSNADLKLTTYYANGGMKIGEKEFSIDLTIRGKQGLSLDFSVNSYNYSVGFSAFNVLMDYGSCEYEIGSDNCSGIRIKNVKVISQNNSVTAYIKNNNLYERINYTKDNDDFIISNSELNRILEKRNQKIELKLSTSSYAQEVSTYINSGLYYYPSAFDFKDFSNVNLESNDLVLVGPDICNNRKISIKTLVNKGGKNLERESFCGSLPQSGVTIPIEDYDFLKGQHVETKVYTESPVANTCAVVLEFFYPTITIDPLPGYPGFHFLSDDSAKVFLAFKAKLNEKINTKNKFAEKIILKKGQEIIPYEIDLFNTAKTDEGELYQNIKLSFRQPGGTHNMTLEAPDLNFIRTRFKVNVNELKAITATITEKLKCDFEGNDSTGIKYKITEVEGGIDDLYEYKLSNESANAWRRLLSSSEELTVLESSVKDGVKLQIKNKNRDKVFPFDLPNTISKTIVENPDIEITDPILCFDNGKIEFINKLSIYKEYQITTPDNKLYKNNTGIFEELAAGKYKYQILTHTGCYSKMKSINLLKDEFKISEIEVNDKPDICDGKNVFTIKYEQPNNTENVKSYSVNYSVSSSSDVHSILYLPENEIYFEVPHRGRVDNVDVEIIYDTDEYGSCSYNDETHRIPLPAYEAPDVEIETKDVINYGENEGEITINIDSNTNCEYYALLFKDRNLYLEHVFSGNSVSFKGLEGRHDGCEYIIDIFTKSDIPIKLETVYIKAPKEKLTLQKPEVPILKCHGATTGVVELTASGGWEEYEYSDDGEEFSTNSTFTGLGKGTYTFWVRDKNGATASESITLVDPTPVAATVTAIPACYGDSKGAIEISDPTGGAIDALYQYKITNNDTIVCDWNEFVIDENGEYKGKCNVKVSDDLYKIHLKALVENECEHELLFNSVKIENNPEINFDYDYEPIICSDGKTDLVLNVSGGAGHYTIDIADKKTNELLVDSNGQVPLYDSICENDIENEGISCYTFPDYSAGEYEVTVYDKYGCSKSKDITIEKYINPSILSHSLTDMSCNGVEDGEITFDVNKGSGKEYTAYLKKDSDKQFVCFDFEEDKTEASISFNKLSAGNYQVYIKDENGCSSDTIIDIVINEPAKFDYLSDIIIGNVVNKGEKDGSVRFNIKGGNSGKVNIYLDNVVEEIEISTIDHSINDDFTVVDFLIGVGTHKFIVQDSKKCEFVIDDVKILEPESKLDFTYEKTDALCSSNSGSITVKPTGGWGGYEYKISNRGYSSNDTFTDLSQGNKIVTVRDREGAEVSEPIVISDPGKYFSETVIKDFHLPSCNNINDGVLTIEIKSETGPYKVHNATYSSEVVEYESNIFNLEGISVGYQTIVIENDFGCEAHHDVIIPETAVLHIVEEEVDFATNSTSNDGAISVSVAGGTEPYSYLWEKAHENGNVIINSTESNLKELSEGTYILTVIDSTGCDIIEQFYVPSYENKSLVLHSKEDETGFIRNDGYAKFYNDYSAIDNIKITHNGVTSVISEDISSYLSDNLIEMKSLSPGSYTIVISGDKGIQYYSFTIKKYQEFSFGSHNLRHVNKIGNSDGYIEVAVKGGVGPYSYELINDELNVNISQDNNGFYNLEKEKYSIKVIDYYKNKIDTVIEIIEPSEELSFSYSHNDIKCFGDETGNIKVNPIGGIGKKYVSIDSDINFSKANNFHSLPANTYRIYVADEQGNIYTEEITLTEPELFVPKVALIDSVKCIGQQNGVVYFDISGGVTPYKYQNNNTSLWFNDTKQIDDKNLYYWDGLNSGAHLFYFKDENNCIDSLEFYMPEPELFRVSSSNVTNTTCGKDNGALEVVLQGGTLPYSYQWRKYGSATVVGTSAKADNLAPMQYKLVAKDKNNCETTLTKSVFSSRLLSIGDIETTETLCYGDDTGEAKVLSITPGLPKADYKIYWPNGDDEKISKGYEAGTYTLKVVDDNNCETSKNFTITSPPELKLASYFVKEPLCFGYDNGEIYATIVGGTGKHTYFWSDGSLMQNLYNVPKGNYSLLVTDENDCQLEESFEVDEPIQLEVNIGDNITICPGSSIDIDGQDFYGHQWLKGEEVISTNKILTISEEGEYVLIANDQKGCLAYDTINVKIGNDALQSEFLMTSSAVVGDTILLYELSNLPLDSLTWNFSLDAFQDYTPTNEEEYILHLKSVKDGVYDVNLLAYSSGCVSSRTKQIEVVALDDYEEIEKVIGYKEPIIKSFIVSPNPNDGRFNVKIELCEKEMATLSLYDAVQGLTIERRSLDGLDFYNEQFVIDKRYGSIYILTLNVKNEQKQLKIIIE